MLLGLTRRSSFSKKLTVSLFRVDELIPESSESLQAHVEI